MGLKKDLKDLKKEILKDLKKSKYTEKTKANITKFLEFLKEERNDKGN